MSVVTVIDFLNRVLTPVFDLVCWPFRTVAPIWAMTVISLATGIVMVWIFGKVSDQETIKRIRDHIRGNLIGVRLYQHDIGVVIRLQRRIFGDTFHYMRLALVPMVVLLVPVVLIMTQLSLRFEARPLLPGEAVIVKAYVRDIGSLDKNVTLEVGNGVSVETRGVRIPSTREIAWRIRAESSGEHVMVIRVGEDAIDTHLVVGDQWGAVSQRRTGRGMWDTLTYPGEPPIPSSHPVEAVEIVYPSLDLSVFGLAVNWVVAFFGLSMVFGFAFKDMLGVEV